MPGVLVLLLSCLVSNPGFTRGIYNTRESTYQEDLKNSDNLEIVQALAPNPGGYMEIADIWTWYQPGKQAGNPNSHGTRFSSAGSATHFTTIETGGSYGEEVSLLSRWFSAVSDMAWSSNSVCPNGETDPKCIVLPLQSFPVEAGFGARSASVLRVPKVQKFGACDSSPQCETDFIIAALTLEQKTWKDFMVPGFPYSATFFLRYPGAGGPPVGGITRLGKMIIYYTYKVGTSPDYEYMGGATPGCADYTADMCGGRNNTGCPWSLVTDTPGRGELEFYLGNVYTPFTYSFCAGENNGYMPIESNTTPPKCKRCQDSPAYPACRDPIEGSWVFILNSDISGGICDTVNCGNAKADASLHFDGIKLTAGGVRISSTMEIYSTVFEDAGSYVSPVFDSLSPFTRWDKISWIVDQNRDGNGWARTPVRLKWREGQTPNPWAGTGWYGTGGTHFRDMVPFTSSLEGMVDTGTTPLLDGSVPPVSRYFQYETDLTSWSENLMNRPPRRPTGGADYKSCARYLVGYDGTLVPQVSQVGVTYIPDAGQFISSAISPPKLKAWKALFFDKEDAGGVVTVDILDKDNNIIMAGVTSGVLLNSLDPGRYPAIKVRAILVRNGVGGADPKFRWFRVEYEPQEDLISIDKNSLRLARNDGINVRIFVERSGMVELRIYDAAGQLVKGVFRGEVEGPQMLQVSWNGRDSRGGSVAPGVYFVTAITPSGRQTGRVAVAR